MDNIRIEIGSLKDFFDFVLDGKNKFFSGAKGLWYRGHQDQDHFLVPSLYRLVTSVITDKKIFWGSLREYEDLFLDQFKARSYYTIHGRLPENRLMLFSYMQHYGTRTRLLDWSENVLTAFFFAVENYFPGASQTRKNALEGKLPCVWAFNPIEFNKVMRDRYTHIFNAKDIHDPFRKIKFPEMTPMKTNKGVPTLLGLTEQIPTDDNAGWSHIPVAALAPYNSERIKSQEGTFVIFPCHETFFKEVKLKPPYTLDKLQERDKFLRQFILCKPEAISKELKLLGVRKSKIYPELPNISMEIEDSVLLNTY